jgi:intein-encoded DNA endonuclease-like protein
MPASNTFPIYDRVLGGRLEALLRRWRAEGLSYEAIAHRLADDHGVTVTGQTVRRWLVDLDQGAA